MIHESLSLLLPSQYAQTSSKNPCVKECCAGSCAESVCVCIMVEACEP